MEQQYLTIWDLVLTPIYLMVLIFLAKRHRDKNYPVGHPLRKYYLPGLYIKFFGAIFIALVYQYYYGGGDTFNFFNHSRIINSALHDSFSTWLKLIFHTSPDSDPKLYAYTSQMEFYNNPSSHAVNVICALFGLLNFTTYIPIALLFAYLSYSGIWAMYRTFTSVYPSLYKALAFAFLFIPSVCVWGSSIFKDTVCLFGLGWMTYTTFRIFIHKDFSLKNFLLLFLSFYLIAIIKVYILLAFIPALVFWLLSTYSHRIKMAAARVFIQIIVTGVVIGGFFYFSQQFSKELNQYSLDKILKTSEQTKNYIFYVSDQEQGSKYDLGNFEPTFLGVIQKFPAGVAVTLFRPFLWEVTNPLMLLSAFESAAFLFLTLFVFFKKGIGRTFRTIFNDPNLIFFLLFSLIFAFAVGISSYNFGTLSRYKIPCMPFYAAFLMVLLYKDKVPATIQKKKNSKTSMGYVAFPPMLKYDQCPNCRMTVSRVF